MSEILTKQEFAGALVFAYHPSHLERKKAHAALKAHDAALRACVAELETDGIKITSRQWNKEQAERDSLAAQLATSEAARDAEHERAEANWASLERIKTLYGNATQERDAAIKRAEELAHVQNLLRGAELLIIFELKNALEHIASVLGPGSCTTNNCQGCCHEMDEAFRTAQKALETAAKDDLSQRAETLHGRISALERHNGALREALKIYANPDNFVQGNDWVWKGDDNPTLPAKKALASVPVEPQGKPPAEPIKVGDTVRHNLGQASVVSVHPTIHESFAELSDGYRKPFSQLERVEPLSTVDKAELSGSFYQSKSIAELALEQNVKPIESISELRGIWPLDKPDPDSPTGTANDQIPRETVEAIEPDPNCKRCGGSGEFINWDARWPCYCVRGSAGIKMCPPACPNCAGMRKALGESIEPLTVLSEMFEKGYARAMQDNAVDAAVSFNGMAGMVNKALASAKEQLEGGK